MKNTIDEIEGLLARATPGPWAASHFPEIDRPFSCIYQDGSGCRSIIVNATHAHGKGQDDASLIVALRNSAVDLIAVVRAAAKVAAHPRWERSEDHGLAEALARLGVKP